MSHVHPGTARRASDPSPRRPLDAVKRVHPVERSSKADAARVGVDHHQPHRYLGDVRGPTRRDLDRCLEDRRLLIVLGLLTTVPLWLTSHPPIQDWPQHLAAIRVLHSFEDPEFGFQRYFVLRPGETQYLTVYYAAHLLSYAVGVEAAAKLVASLALLALPLSVRALLTSLGRSPSGALLSLPLAYNAQVVLGFLNFCAALPLMLFGIALAVRQRSSPTAWRPWVQCVALIACFYTHVVPFALAVLGSALCAVGRSPSDSLRRLWPAAAAGLAALPWLVYSPAGSSLLEAAGLRAEPTQQTTYAPFMASVREAPGWLIDVWQGDWDGWALIAWSVIGLGWVLAGRIGAVKKSRPAASVPARHVTARLLLLPAVSALGYLLAPASHGWIWPIGARFALPALLLLVAIVPAPMPSIRTPFALGNAVLAVVVTWHVGLEFLAFEKEVGPLDGVLARIPPAERVAGLIWARGSRSVRFSPFLHSVAYYQARRGGAVMFTFADFPQSLFRFRRDQRPPRVPPRWEWLPERVEPDRDLSWYDWILVRGGPNRLRHSRQFTLVHEGFPWRLWRRTRWPRIP